MNIVTLDFETYWDADYTLSKMTTEAYVRDPRFEVHGCAVRMPDGEIVWSDRDGDEFEIFNVIDWSTTACLCHHAHFDGLILSHHYGIKPAFWLDTLSMARLLIGNHLSASLESLAKHFGLGAKNVPYDLFKGKHWGEIAPEAQRQIAEGCCNDVQLTWDLFCKLAHEFPVEEYGLVDGTVRMFTEAVLVGDTGKLAAIWESEQRAKAELLQSLATTGKDIRSNETFADLLRVEGVDLATRDAAEVVFGLNTAQEHFGYAEGWKRGKRGPIYAFARTDDFMRDLLDNGSPRVQALVEARLSERSNIVQTRSCRLGWMSTRGAMPVYLSYCGAHTTRWSGGDKVNWQNFPRDSELGGEIRAQDGFRVVVNDASQIECRILNMVAGQNDVIERFRNHEDPYISIASQFYGFPVTKANPRERGTGKQLELSCGYGAGGPTIKATAKNGTYGPPVFITDEDALRARDLYRSTHPAVTALWQAANDVLKKINAGMEFDWHCLHIKGKRIYLPNGCPLIYETLEWSNEDGQNGFRLRTRKGGWTRIWGSKCVENVIQALARLHVSQAWLRCAAVGIRMVSMEHDKLIAVVAEHEADAALAFMQAEMKREPEWLPGIPLDSEGYVSRTFAKEKT